MIRMFRPAVYGGRLPSIAAVTFSRWMLPTTPAVFRVGRQ